MRRHNRKMAKDCVRVLGQGHDAIRKSLETKQRASALDLLSQCQDVAIQLGGIIEQDEGEGFATVKILEEYCEFVFQVYTLIAQNETLNPNKVHKQLKNRQLQIQKSIREDTKDRIEAVFLPYKASMWDSLESVWMAAEQDENCDAYVIPIPYFGRNPDGSVKEVHYEGEQFPEYVPITGYKEYDFQERHPDMIFIHNPYDDCNYVTSVHPFFYSYHLKQYTDLLVYIPYFSTAGGMSEGQKSCSAYYYADYIIMQAEKYRKFYDPQLPQKKLQPLGSPKFDRVIRMCQNPPEPPASWKEKMEGKKVYFYNTSINGMLGNTKRFLKKMKYVFECFEGRTDACLLWRPHPLLESTFDSLRREQKPVYEELKAYFMEKDLGIYDDTPDMTTTIALSDVYIGDSGTSVTSLFGLVGKPLFILNNDINSEPGPEDWRGQIVRGFPAYDLAHKEAWMVTQGNKLYRSTGDEGFYHYFCDLSEYAYGNYYGMVVFVNGKRYVCPISAQDLLVIGQEGIERRIELQKYVERPGAFYTAAVAGDFLFLLPNQYPAIVRYDTVKDEICYYKDNLDVFISLVNGERRCGGCCVQGGKLYLASPADRRVLRMDPVTGEQQVLTVGGEGDGGWMVLSALPNEEEIWMLPFKGKAITRWNPGTGEVREYRNCPEDFQCVHGSHGYICEDRPFSNAVIYKDHLYLSPYWGNRYLCLDVNSGEMTEWKPPVEEPEEEKNGYYASWAKGWIGYLLDPDTQEIRKYLLFSYYDRKGYEIDFIKCEARELAVTFDTEELRNQESGFAEESQWLQYSCQENAWNSLPDFLDGKVTGQAFDRERQIRDFGEIAANHDGTSGEKIYHFVQKELQRQ